MCGRPTGQMLPRALRYPGTISAKLLMYLVENLPSERLNAPHLDASASKEEHKHYIRQVELLHGQVDRLRSMSLSCPTRALRVSQRELQVEGVCRGGCEGACVHIHVHSHAGVHTPLSPPPDDPPSRCPARSQLLLPHLPP